MINKLVPPRAMHLSNQQISSQDWNDVGLRTVRTCVQDPISELPQSGYWSRSSKIVDTKPDQKIGEAPLQRSNQHLSSRLSLMVVSGDCFVTWWDVWPPYWHQLVWRGCKQSTSVSTLLIKSLYQNSRATIWLCCSWALSLFLTLADVMPTGHRAKREARAKGDKVVVIGDGAVQCVIAAKMRGIANRPHESPRRPSTDGLSQAHSSYRWAWWRISTCQGSEILEVEQMRPLNVGTAAAVDRFHWGSSMEDVYFVGSRHTVPFGSDRSKHLWWQVEQPPVTTHDKCSGLRLSLMAISIQVASSLIVIAFLTRLIRIQRYGWTQDY